MLRYPEASGCTRAARSFGVSQDDSLDSRYKFLDGELPRPLLHHIQRFFEIALLAEADEFLLDLSVAKEDDGGYRADAVFDGDVAVYFGIDLSNLQFACI